MKHESICLDAELRQRMVAGGDVNLLPKEDAKQKRYFLTASELTQLVKKHSRGGGTSHCDSVKLENIHIEGPLDLSSAGSEAEPLARLQFISCVFEGGACFNQASLKGIVIIGGSLASGSYSLTPSLRAEKATILEELRVCSFNSGTAGAYLDFTGAVMKRGCMLEDVGASKFPFERISFKGAEVAGDATFRRVRIVGTSAKRDQSALNLERFSVSGTLLVTGFCDAGPDIKGQINLRGAAVGGRLRLEALYIEVPQISAVESHSDRAAKVLPQAAVFARLIRVAGDVLLRANDDQAMVKVFGQIDFSDARIGGDLKFFGTFDSHGRIRAIRACRSKIEGNIRFGRLEVEHSSYICSVTGECDFSGATIDGDVTFSGSKHRISTVSTDLSKVRYSQGQAISFRDATIGRDLRFESENRKNGFGEQCDAEGLCLIGSTINGRLLIGGSRIAAKVDDNRSRKAITANGATIHGGIDITEDEFCDSLNTTIEGDIRLRNARVGGPFVIRGATLTCSGYRKGEKAQDKTSEQSSDFSDLIGLPQRNRGVALWASNTQFGSDVIFRPSKYHKLDVEGDFYQEAQVHGELRFWGASIAGTLFIQGTTLKSVLETSTALDCYIAEIKKGVVIEPYIPGEKWEDATATHIEGIVSLSFAKIQLLRVGKFLDDEHRRKKRRRISIVDADDIEGSASTS